LELVVQVVLLPAIAVVIVILHLIIMVVMMTPVLTEENLHWVV
jgi:hypothetical protein